MISIKNNGELDKTLSEREVKIELGPYFGSNGGVGIAEMLENAHLSPPPIPVQSPCSYITRDRLASEPSTPSPTSKARRKTPHHDFDHYLR